MMRRLCIAAWLLLGAVACGPEPGPPLLASDIHITRPVPGRSMAAGYLTLENRTDRDIAIDRVDSPDYAGVSLHTTRIDNGVARMRPVEALIVPAHGRAVLQRGGDHLMLRDPAAGSDTVTLHFFAGEERVLTVETRPGGGG